MSNRGADYVEHVIRSLPAHRAAMMARHIFLGYRYRCDSEPSMGQRWWRVTRPSGAKLSIVVSASLTDTIVTVQTDVERQEKRAKDLACR